MSMITNIFRKLLFGCCLTLLFGGLAEVGIAGYPRPESVNIRVGYIRPNGQFAIKPQWLEASGFSEGFAAVSAKAEHWQYITKSGDIAFTNVFEEATAFSEGLAAVKHRGKWGYIDSFGQWVLQPRYVRADPFRKGVAVVSFNYTYRLIDRMGRTVMFLDGEYRNRDEDHLLFSETIVHWPSRTSRSLPPKCRALYLSEGHVIVNYSYDGPFDPFDPSAFLEEAAFSYEGKMTVPPAKRSLLAPEEGLFPFYGENGWGYMKAPGEVVIAPRYRIAYGFEGGRALVAQQEKDEKETKEREKWLWGVINRRGEIVVPIEAKDIIGFSEGLAAINDVDDKWRIIDANGVTIGQIKCLWVDRFSEGLAKVSVPVSK
jgi:hypothetical protein